VTGGGVESVTQDELNVEDSMLVVAKAQNSNEKQILQIDP